MPCADLHHDASCPSGSDEEEASGASGGDQEAEGMQEEGEEAEGLFMSGLLGMDVQVGLGGVHACLVTWATAFWVPGTGFFQFLVHAWRGMMKSHQPHACPPFNL